MGWNHYLPAPGSFAQHWSSDWAIKLQSYFKGLSPTEASNFFLVISFRKILLVSELSGICGNSTKDMNWTAINNKVKNEVKVNHFKQLLRTILIIISSLAFYWGQVSFLLNLMINFYLLILFFSALIIL